MPPQPSAEIPTLPGAFGFVWPSLATTPNEGFAFLENAVIDLHDLCTIFMYERARTDKDMRSYRLKSTEHGPLKGVAPEDIQPWDLQPGENRGRQSYLLIKESTLQEGDIPLYEEPLFAVSPSSFVLPSVTEEKTMAAMNQAQRELAFWRCKNTNQGYFVARSLQNILDAMPASVSLDIRLKNRSGGRKVQVHQFGIIETPVFLKELTHMMMMETVPNTTKVQVWEKVFGGEGGMDEWVFLLFGSPEVVDGSDDRIALDLSLPVLGARGAAGEMFALQNCQDYLDKLHGLVFDVGELRLSGRIANVGPGVTAGTETAIRTLADGVLGRLRDIIVSGATFCASCGAPNPPNRCSKCRKVHYCSVEHSRSSWAFHKAYCE